MVNEIANICINNRKLVIIYNKTENSLSDFFEVDEEMRNYINSNIDEAFKYSILEKGKGEYVLNIASTENFGNFNDWNGMKTLLDNQLSIFMPIIQKFILYVNTGYLK